MSAWDFIGAPLWGVLAVLFWVSAMTPAKPPKPAYGGTEISCFFIAIVLTAAALFCVARLFGAHL